jgi:hypothetical protein
LIALGAVAKDNDLFLVSSFNDFSAGPVFEPHENNVDIVSKVISI